MRYVFMQWVEFVSAPHKRWKWQLINGISFTQPPGVRFLPWTFCSNFLTTRSPMHGMTPTFLETNEWAALKPEGMQTNKKGDQKIFLI